MKRIITSLACAAFVLAVASCAHAEVMDKETSIPGIWAFALVGGFSGVILWRLRWWTGIAALVPPALLLSGVYCELRDLSVGPGILREAGPGYERNFWLAVGALAFCQVIGAASWLRGRRRTVGRTT